MLQFLGHKGHGGSVFPWLAWALVRDCAESSILVPTNAKKNVHFWRSAEFVHTQFGERKGVDLMVQPCCAGTGGSSKRWKTSFPMRGPCCDNATGVYQTYCNSYDASWCRVGCRAKGIKRTNMNQYCLALTRRVADANRCLRKKVADRRLGTWDSEEAP